MSASELALHSSMSISAHDQSSPNFLNICKLSPDTSLTGLGASPGSVIKLKFVPSLSPDAVADWVEWGRWGWRTEAKPTAENETGASSVAESAQSTSLNPAAAPVDASSSATEVGFAAFFFFFFCLVVSSHHFAQMCISPPSFQEGEPSNLVYLPKFLRSRNLETSAGTDEIVESDPIGRVKSSESLDEAASLGFVFFQ